MLHNHFLMRSIKAKIVLWSLLAGAGVNAQNAGKTSSFKNAFRDKFYIGVAINRQQAMGNNPTERKLIDAEFNCISPENDLKWENIHPTKDAYNFGPADAYVKTGKDLNMFIIGHTLLWHSQTPKWVFEDDNGTLLKRDALLERLKDHINKVVGRYKGVIKGWDVVNEALNEDGSLRDSKWRTIIGDDYIDKAFEYAHAADPAAELYYNDYNLYKKDKCEGAVKIAERLRAKGLPIKAVGEQGHYSLAGPSLNEIEATIKSLVKAGVAVNITELDVSVLPDKGAAATADVSNSAAYNKELDPYKSGLPTDIEQKLADRYASLFELFVKYEKNIDRVTFWGLSDRDTWLNNWPIRGRTNYPLPFNRDLSSKTKVKMGILKTAN
jgi:endo-1,4-beta-xylanase